MNYPAAAPGYQKTNLFRPKGRGIDPRQPEAGIKEKQDESTG